MTNNPKTKLMNETEIENISDIDIECNYHFLDRLKAQSKYATRLEALIEGLLEYEPLPNMPVLMSEAQFERGYNQAIKRIKAQAAKLKEDM